MRTANATQAIETVKNIKTTFMGHEVQKYNSPLEIRDELSRMSERNEITPAAYWAALKITWAGMLRSKALMAAEHAEIN